MAISKKNNKKNPDKINYQGLILKFYLLNI